MHGGLIINNFLCYEKYVINTVDISSKCYIYVKKLKGKTLVLPFTDRPQYCAFIIEEACGRCQY